MSDAMAPHDLDWVPSDLSVDRPNVARIYDYLLGGYHNFEIDRMAAKKVREIYPDLALKAQSLRAFTRRSTLFLIEQGIDQVLDIGSGIPTVGNVHEVAQGANPAARVVYVDIDPVAVAHSQAILRGNSQATAIQADLRQPERILNHPEVKRLLDLSEPVGLLLVAVLHFIPDDQEAFGAVKVLRDALASGSYMVLVHGTYDKASPEVIRRIEKVGSSSPTSTHYRSIAQVREFFEGFDLLEPGLVPVALWRPEGTDDPFVDKPEHSLGVAGVAHKP